MKTFVHREFNDYDKDGNLLRKKYASHGDIQLTFKNNNYIDVLISRLHDWGEGVQAFMCIKYASNLNLYETALTVLNRITEDLLLQYGEPQYSSDDDADDGTDTDTEVPIYKDFIINYDSELEPGVWNIDKKGEKTNNGGDVWLPFTRENAKYITETEEIPEDFNVSKTDPGVPPNSAALIIRGEVAADGTFTYDYPILGSSDTIEMYMESRGKLDYYSTQPDHMTGVPRNL